MKRKTKDETITFSEELIPIYDTDRDIIEQLPKVEKTEQEWKELLSQEAFRVTRKKGTEPPFSGAYHALKERGIFKCVACATDLFSSEHKFDSGTGWPSFWQPVSEQNIVTRSDRSFFMERTEVLCARCEAHLGHVFDDGPAPTNKRYCINAAALSFESRE